MKRLFAAVLLFVGVPSLVAQTEFSQENAAAILKHLAVDLGPRPMGSPIEHDALLFATEKFREYGCDTAYIMPMTRSSRANTTSGIAVGIKRGATGRIILIGGHIDSAGPEIPGADDDGSGSAVVLECARVLGKQSRQSTLVFCCFGGEEQGLEGSRFFADHFGGIDSIALMLQIDMANGLGIIDMDPDVGGGLSAPSWLPRAAAEEFSRLGYDHLRYPTHFFSLNYAREAGAGSDHESFLRKGIPAIDFSTDVAKPIHTPRDNFENFDPRGLKRSGDLVLRLAERFDSGIPSRELGRYWLFLIGTTPVFIPIWGIWMFAGLAALTAIVALIALRRRKEIQTERIRWSGLKLWFYSLIITTCGWFSSDLIGVVRGMRHPWFTAIDAYYVLAFFAMIVGGWIAATLARRLRLAYSPFGLFARAVVILVLILVGLCFLSTKLVVEPAAALFLISLAMIFRKPSLKFAALLLSPWWILRLLFTEWDTFLFRATANGDFGSTPILVFRTLVFPLVFSIWILPFLFASAAIMRDAPVMKSLIDILRSRRTLVVTSALVVALSTYLLAIPVYDNLWYREVRVDEEYSLDQHAKSVRIKSPEFLYGLHLQHGGRDTLISGRTIALEVTPAGSFDTSWMTIERKDSVAHPTDSLTEHHMHLRLAMTRRPYTVAITYARGEKVIAGFDTPYEFRNSKTGEVTIEWYSFPDTVLVVPVEFSVPARDSVKETIEVTFNALAYPMTYALDHAYFIPRTKYVAHQSYE